MVELHEVLISDIHTAALTQDVAGELRDGDVGMDLPDGVYPVSVSVRLDRGQRGDDTDTELRPPQYPVEVKYPTGSEPYIPETTVWLENPAVVDNRGDKVWDNQKFATKLLDEIKKIETKDPDAPSRFYLTGAKFVEILDKSYLVEDRDGRMRPTQEFFEDHGEMSIAHFSKRPSITDEEVRQKLEDEGALSGQVKQPLQLTRYDRVWAKPHNRSQSTRRFWTPGQAKNNPGVEVANVRPRAYKLPENITEKDDDDGGWSVSDLNVGLDESQTAFPVLSASELWLKVTFIGNYESADRFKEEEVIIHNGRATLA